MRIIHRGEVRPSRDPEHFAGDATLLRFLDPDEAEGMTTHILQFRDGARTYWHAHRGVQILVVLEGEGRIATEGMEHRLAPGDVVFCPPGERHWHGAAPGASTVHLSVTTGGLPEWLGPPPE
ncbi:MAG: cupin domain-containing protein [Thermomicrobiaceae bacterium]|nr:cupin domain-containing protein [Thermomicrobiaceae bacterium]